jgi:hypothetical protein
MANMNGRNGNGTKSTAQIRREVDEFIDKAEARTPNQAAYERRELAEAQQKLREIEKAPLADRKEAAASFFEAMRDRPDVVGERVGWLLAGNYGYGSMQMAKRILSSPRMNRAAALTHMIAAFEWSTPGAMARAGWKKLTPSQKANLDRAVQKEIRAAETES